MDCRNLEGCTTTKPWESCGYGYGYSRSTFPRASSIEAQQRSAMQCTVLLTTRDMSEHILLHTSRTGFHPHANSTDQPPVTCSQCTNASFQRIRPVKQGWPAATIRTQKRLYAEMLSRRRAVARMFVTRIGVAAAARHLLSAELGSACLWLCAHLAADCSRVVGCDVTASGNGARGGRGTWSW